MILNTNMEPTENGLLETLDLGRSVYSAGNTAHNYIYESAYESYIQTKISNEERLKDMINSKLSIKIESTVILEAKAGDKIKSKWNKLIEFIKGICSKFMESMSNILLSEKEYLEKYKDIILKKKPKEDLKYSYTGDYAVGIDRLIKTECPVFNYATFSEDLKQEGDGAVVKKIMSKSGQSGFTFDEGQTLAEQFKAYFTAADKGQSDGNFSTLNMTDLYNFCYNFEQIKKIVSTDQKHLEQSTGAIDTAIKEEIRKAGEQTTTDQTDNSQQQTQQTGNQGGQQEGAMLEDGQNGNGQQQQSGSNGNQQKPQKLQITQNTNAVSQMSSYGNGDKKNLSDEEVKKGAEGGAAEADGQDANDAINKITEMTDKWVRVCRALIASKLTACEQISRDYMDIIRAHVRSYGGKDLKNKEDDKAPQKGTNYRKPEQNNNNGDQQQQQNSK